MQCHECNYQLSPFDSDCPRCKNLALRGYKPAKTSGIELDFGPEPQVRLTEPQKPAEAAKSQCAQCARSLEPDWLACPYCGTGLNDFAAPLLHDQQALPAGPELLTPHTQSVATVMHQDQVPIAVNNVQPVLSNSATQLARMIVALALLSIGVPGVFAGGAMMSASPAADKVAAKEVYLKASGDVVDPIEHSGESSIAKRNDEAGNETGTLVVLFSAALCVPGVIVLIGATKRQENKC